ncbi:hypothetical protein GCM10020256_36120 [Streptomyces thermocoprophilus]
MSAAPSRPAPPPTSGAGAAPERLGGSAPGNAASRAVGRTRRAAAAAPYDKKHIERGVRASITVGADPDATHDGTDR